MRLLVQNYQYGRVDIGQICLDRYAYSFERGEHVPRTFALIDEAQLQCLRCQASDHQQLKAAASAMERTKVTDAARVDPAPVL